MPERGAWPFRTDLTLLLLVGAQPLESAFPTTSGAGSPTKLAAALCFATFFLDMAATRRRLTFDATHAMLLGILAIGLMSSIGARSQADAFETVLRYAGFVGLYLILTQFAGDDRELLRVVWVLTISCAIAAGLALQHFLAGDALLATPTYGDPNDFAYIVATSLPLGVWLLVRAPRGRALAAIAVLIMIAGVGLSLSRGAAVALAAGLGWLVLTEARARRPLVVATVAAVVVGGAFLAANEDRVSAAVSTKEHVAAANVGARLDLWRSAAILAAEHPLLGVGPGNFPFHQLDVNDQPQGFATYVVHDAYLDVAAELGLVAAALFVAFLAMQLVRVSRAAGATDVGDLAVAVRAALVVALVGAVTLSEQYFAPMWILSGLATALWCSARIADRIPVARPVPVHQ